MDSAATAAQLSGHDGHFVSVADSACHNPQFQGPATTSVVTIKSF